MAYEEAYLRILEVFVFFVTLVFTIFIEVLVTKAYSLWKKLVAGVYGVVLAGNVLSGLLIWYIFPFLPLQGMALVLANVFGAILVEYAVLLWIAKKMSWKDAFYLSVIMNAVTWLVGNFTFFGL